MQSLIYSNALEKNNRKLRVYAAVLVFIMICIAGYALKNSVFRKTIAVTGQEQAVKPGDYVSITSDRYFYMGFVDKKKNKTTGYYYLVEAGDAFFVTRSRKSVINVKNDETRIPVEFKGIVRSDSNRSENTAALLKMKMPQEIIDRHLSQYVISDKNTNSKAWMFFLLIPLAFAVYGKFNGIGNNRKNKERIEQNMSLMSAEQSFDSEFNMQSGYVKAGNLHITQNWLFSRITVNTFLMPLNEVVWTYKTVTQNSANGIPTGKSYKITIVFSDGSMTDVVMNEADCNTAIEGLAVRGKKIIIGFTDELMALWKADSKKFIEEWHAGRGLI